MVFVIVAGLVVFAKIYHFVGKLGKNRILIPFDVIFVPITAIILQAVDSGC